MKPKTAFTKKEILVVLGCVLFLLTNIAAIGTSGRRRAKQALCLSNLRQWGVILQTYAQDNDGYFPCDEDSWMNELRPYYKDCNDLRLCPLAARPVEGASDHGMWPHQLIGDKFKAWGKYSGQTGSQWITKGDYGSYGINNWICHKLGTSIDTGTRYWRTPNVAGTADIPMFLDCISHCSHGYEGPREEQGPPQYEGDRNDSAMKYYCINRHNGGINGVFMDSSARKIGLKELWTFKWSRRFDTKGPWTTAGGVTHNDWPKWMNDFKDY